MKYLAIFLLTMAVNMIIAQNYVGESKRYVVMKMEQMGYNYVDEGEYIELCDPTYHSLKTWYFVGNVCYKYQIQIDKKQVKSYKKALDIVKHKQTDSNTWELWEHGNVFITDFDKNQYLFTTVQKTE